MRGSWHTLLVPAAEKVGWATADLYNEVKNDPLIKGMTRSNVCHHIGRVRRSLDIPVPPRPLPTTVAKYRYQKPRTQAIQHIIDLFNANDWDRIAVVDILVTEPEYEGWTRRRIRERVGATWYRYVKLEGG